MALSTDDHIAIQQLYARYNFAIDDGKAADWAACFTADGTFASPNGTFAGKDQLLAFATGFGEQLKVRHWVNNLVVEADGPGAKGACYLLLLNRKTNPASPMATATYDDRLAKTAGGWRFTSRSVAMDA